MRLIVIGGGAAGFFCAVNAARFNPAMEVIILEKSSKLLSKVRVSGGGRCNVTHACFSLTEMANRYPRGANFVKKTFHQFFTTDTINWFRERGVELKTEDDGRMFPITDSAETIIDCLLAEADRYRVRVKTRAEVVKMVRNEIGWELTLKEGDILRTDVVCLACGGYPKEEMFEWLASTGHSIEKPVPSLFTFNMPGSALRQLMGVSVPARAKIAGTKLDEQGPVLLTHWGMSGPAILKLSARGARTLAESGYRFRLLLNWLPKFNEQSFREWLLDQRKESGAAKVWNRNPLSLPRRFWEYLCAESSVSDQLKWADLSAASMNTLARKVCAGEFPVDGKTTFKEEFVTAGGIRLSEVNSETMESRIAPGLYFAGEILDVDGITGGYNFQHAWTSGWIAGKCAARAAGTQN